MKNYIDDNTASELLTQLIDGELDSNLESELYDQMANSPELQLELKSHLAVREAIQKDMEAFVPPAESVSAIFSSLGYAPPPTAGVLKKTPLILAFFKRALVPIAILLVASITGYTLLNTQDSTIDANLANSSSGISAINSNNNIDESAIESTDNQQSGVNNSTIIAGDLSKKANKIPIIKLSSSDNLSNIANASKEEIILVSDNSYNNGENYSNKNEQIYLINLANYDTKFNNSISFELPSRFNNIVSIPEIDNSNSKTVALYIKGINNINSDLGSSFSSNSNLLDNISLGFTYLSSGMLKFGFEIGQQNFAVSETNPMNELDVINRVQPVFWYAATIKHNAEYLELFNTTPYAQAAIGSGNFGKFMTRYSLGLESRPFNSNYGIIVGYENSNLMYSIQNNAQSLTSTINSYFIGITASF